MSRSNPTDNMPHPCTRWIEWDGSEGEFRYYDKDAKKNVPLGNAMTFILLDQLATIKGWHDPSESAIYSNEVRDIRQDVLVVKAFKGGTLAEGTYKSISDRVKAQGGYFTANCYIAIKDGENLAIASVQFKGAALSTWMDFTKAHRADLYKKAIKCKGFEEGKKGKITYRTPIFHLTDVAPETDAKAVDCDRVLQEFLKGYFSRTKTDQVAHSAKPEGVEPMKSTGGDFEDDVPPRTPHPVDELDDDIPF